MSTKTKVEGNSKEVNQKRKKSNPNPKGPKPQNAKDVGPLLYKPVNRQHWYCNVEYSDETNFKLFDLPPL